VTVPIYAAIWRSVLAPSDFSLHIAGASGVGKSELAALAQQHFGSAFIRTNLPGAWSSTGNSLEALAFTAKDALLVVDDFAPRGSIADVARYHREGDRLLRAQGNRSGRLRMRANGTLAVAKPPRGLVLSTGEDVPHGQSLRGRMLVVEMGAGDLDWKGLTECQAHAASGDYARVMAAFLEWLAPDYDGIPHRVQAQAGDLRQRAMKDGLHRRTPDIVANLAAALGIFLEFAQEVGGLSPQEASGLSDSWWVALLTAADAQMQQQAGSDPVERFMDLIRAAIASGRANVANARGEAPQNPDGWGWHKDSIGCPVPHGDRIGWVDGEDLYLEPDAAFAVVQRLGSAGGENLSISLQTLKKRMHERGVLVTTDERAGQTHLSVRRKIGGVRRNVLHLRGSVVLGETGPCGPHDGS